VSLLSKKTLAKKILQNKKFRDAYVFEHIKRHIPFQVRTMRTERDWSQAKAGEAIGKPQNVISRLESPAYGKLTLQTLLDIARGFDVGLLIKFVPFSRLIGEYEDVSFDALSAASVSGDDEASKKEKQKIEEWAAEVTESTATVVQAAPSFHKAHEDVLPANVFVSHLADFPEISYYRKASTDFSGKLASLPGMFIKGEGTPSHTM
jgi:transcriptional regulator with XRE-family HTH domain